MSVFATSPHLAQPQSPLDSQAHWITPEEQLHRLALPIAAELVFKNKDEFKDLYDVLDSTITEYAARAILRRSNLSDHESEKPLPSLMERAVECLLNPSPLPPHLTTWYTALKRIGKLPEKIPPLPRHILDILEGKCPEQICSEKKLDGTNYKIKDKCTLILVPQELENPDEFEKVIKSYGEKQYPENTNPLQYQYFLHTAREQHGATPFGPTCWILHTNDVLEDSRNKTWSQQAAMVDALARKTFVDWQVPEAFWETFLIITLTEIGTGKKLYENSNEQNGNLSTYARSRQMNQDDRLAIGGSVPSGVYVLRYEDAFVREYLGVAARRKF